MAGDAGEVQKCFDLVPQSSGHALFIQVTAQKLESTSDAHKQLQPRAVHESKLHCNYLYYCRSALS